MSSWIRAAILLVAFLVSFTPSCCQGWLVSRTTTSLTFLAPLAHFKNPPLLGTSSRHKRKIHEVFLAAATELVNGDDDGGRLVRTDGCAADGELQPSAPAPHDHRSDPQRFAPSLVESLDLVGVIRRVASHAATRRGRGALLALVTPEVDLADSASSLSRWEQGSPRDRTSSDRSITTSRERRARLITGTTDTRPSAVSGGALPPAYRARLAVSREEAQDEYRRVEQAMQVFRTVRRKRGGQADVPEADDDEETDGTPFLSQLSYPNLYGHDETEYGILGPWSDDFVVESDDDDWLYFRELDDFGLEHVAQAEQVMNMLLTVREWAASDATQEWAPSLSEVGRRIQPGPVEHALREIRHAVEIVRVRSIVDPLATSTYRFQLNATTFPVIGRLRQRLMELEKRRHTSGSKLKGTTVEVALEELRQEESDMLRHLVRSVVQSRDAVQAGLNAVAELDVLFAKAAFGLTTQGRLPVVTQNNIIDAKQFVHPLLPPRDAVPIDLVLSRNDAKALVVTGMNGGGKTLALKSFGIAVCLVRLGVPIPVEPSKLPRDYLPVVSFFDDIATAVGDRQDVAHGQSTFTSSLNTYSAIIDRLSTQSDRSCLVLLDELGSGTDPESGGAIGQAILERLLQSDLCRAVVTTHSPRLKALAYDSDDIDCASVLQARRDSNLDWSARASRVPTFQLQYGTIGESDALAAASRADPPLPLDVIDRASALLLDANGSHTEKSKYLRALSDSLEGQLRRAEEAARDAEHEASMARQCRIAMASKARSYEMQLSRLVNRVEACYQHLRDSSDDPLTIAGETLEELRVVREHVKSESEMLREQGLKIVPDLYTLSHGESVVVISEGEWNGMAGRVLLREGDAASTRLAKDEVQVLMSNAAITPLPPSKVEDDPPSHVVLVFKRRDLAIWDYDSVWEDDYQTNGYGADDVPTSVPDSKRRLATILTSLKSAGSAPSAASRDARTTPSFKSSRARKAAKSKSKGKNSGR